MPDHLIRAGRKAAAVLIFSTAVIVSMIVLAVHAPAADKGGPANIFDDGLAVPAAAPRWTGFYLGLVGGYDTQTTTAVVDFTGKDFSYGVAGGFDYRIPGTRVVAGIMVDYMKSSAASTLSKLDGSVTAVGRLGILWSDHSLIYGLAGHSWDNLGTSPAKTFNLNDGFIWGAGIETYVAKNVSLKFEYRRVEEGTAMGGLVDQSTQNLRAGINVRF